MGEATILHADLDSFYASVEQRDDSRLRGKPVIVGTGVVLAASYEAKAYGVRTAMTGRQARELCPGAVVVQPRMSAYSAASKAVFEVFHQTTPMVEAMSIDEAFLDVGGLRRLVGEPTTIAAQLRRDVRDQVGLPITVGVARTKFLAKVASAVAKPDGLLVVHPDRELAFLHPLPVTRLWGVGTVTAAKLQDKGILTVGDVAALPRRALVTMLGRAAGHHLHALANGLDPRPIQVGRRRRSVGSQSALGRRPRTAAELDTILSALVDRVSRRLRKGQRTCATVTIRLRFGDFTRATRSHTLPQATDETAVVLATARWLLGQAGPLVAERGLTLLGVAVQNLRPATAIQLTLPLDDRPAPTLDLALDELRDRYGSGSVTRASLLGRQVGLPVPTLPDEPPG
jgi:DNA polymerase IV